jgi:hypothetical protein
MGHSIGIYYNPATQLKLSIGLYFIVKKSYYCSESISRLIISNDTRTDVLVGK